MIRPACNRQEVLEEIAETQYRIDRRYDAVPVSEDARFVNERGIRSLERYLGQLHQQLASMPVEAVAA